MRCAAIANHLSTCIAAPTVRTEPARAVPDERVRQQRAQSPSVAFAEIIAAKAARPPREKDAGTKALERDLTQKLGLKVEIGFDGKGGAVTIHYQTLEQLDEIIARLGR